jgi:hypothetical protein
MSLAMAVPWWNSKLLMHLDVEDPRKSSEALLSTYFLRQASKWLKMVLTSGVRRLLL